MSKVLYAGDSAIMAVLGLEGIEVFPLMDQIWDAGVHLKSALEAAGHTVTRMLSHEAYYNLPETAERLAAYDVLVLSDIGHDTVMLYPGARRNAVPMGPNRLKEIVRFWKTAAVWLTWAAISPTRGITVRGAGTALP
jgi:uncharacterized membrane protein